MVELLAPAGNLQSFNAAINNGADAIYLGLNNFNARGNIENFSVENIREVIKKAHLFGVKVYLTLNTLVLDNEIKDVLFLIKQAIDAKVDAFIVQDIGLAYFLRNKFPNIELHASTQMGLQNIEGVNFVSSLGYKRVVLARETALEEIKRINENSDVEIEYFVQGALCVSFSGNCYLCSILAGASGNRGKCKQFCRLPIEMTTQKYKKEGYLLSTKDFCMLPKLKDLVECGVTSLKIEGRARRPAYVAGVVKVYRQALDNNYSFNKDHIEILKKLFNRGNFISGYFDEDKIIYNKTQNHIGIEIGEVLNFKKGKKFNDVSVLSKHNLIKGDSLKFFVNEKEITSVNVQDVKKIGYNKYTFTTTAIIPNKSKVHLIVDSNLEENLLSNKKRVKVDAYFEGKEGCPALLTLKTCDGEIVEQGENLLEKSKEQPLTKDECMKQLSKMGEEFELQNLTVNLEDVFMPKSQLNSIRRNAIEKFKNKIIEENEKGLNVAEKDFQLKIEKTKQKNDKKVLYFNSLESLEKYMDTKNYLVYQPNDYNLNEIAQFCNKYPNVIVYLSLPVIANQNMIKSLKNLYNNVDNLGVVANNYYAFSFTSPEKTIVGSEMNVVNSFAVEYYLSRGYDKIILSKENFDFSQIKNGNAQLFIETNVSKSLMHFKHCPFKENLGGDCENCKYSDNSKYKVGVKKFKIKRQRLCGCQFVLCESDSYKINNYDLGSVEEI